MASLIQKISKGFSVIMSLALVSLMLGPGVYAHEAENHDSDEESDSLVKERIERERAVQDNRSVLLAHKRNYVLPLAYSNDPNDDVFEPDDSDFGINLDHLEVVFQLSIKAPIAESLFTEEDALFFGTVSRNQLRTRNFLAYAGALERARRRCLLRRPWIFTPVQRPQPAVFA